MERLPKILVIDDEQSIQKLVKASLSTRGYQVIAAFDGERGLKQAQLEHPDLIFLNLMLPGISGWDVLTALKADPELKEAPVVILTATVREGGEEKARSMGASGFLTKPFGIDELVHCVERLLRK